MVSSKITLFVDGAARGNPGPAGIGVVILGQNNTKLKEYYKYIGNTTNNIAEYNALVYGLQEALSIGAKELLIKLDSELVAKQIKGEYKVKNKNIKPLFDQAIHMLNKFEKIEVKHVDRKENKVADKLANKAINLSDLRGQVE